MKLPAITFQKNAFFRFEEVIAKEWLLTDGLGSYASSTVPGINTRKYHGLLVAALNPPGDRTVCLSKLDEDVVVGDATFRLGSNEFHDSIYPDGYRLIEQFSISPFPTYTYSAGKVKMEKTIFMPSGKNATAVTYKLTNQNSQNATVKLYPLLTCRYYHTVIDRLKNPLNFTVKGDPKQVKVSFQRPQATIICHSTDGQFKTSVNIVDGLHFRDETLRGESDYDDCFQPGTFEVQVPGKSQKFFAVTCAVSREVKEAEETLSYFGNSFDTVQNALTKETFSREELLESFYSDHPSVPASDWLNWIILAADSFLVQNAAGKKFVIAGYHWFEPWGRDTFISLPGLLLVTGKYKVAKDLLVDFIQYCKGGLIPNFVTDKTGVPVYNTVDGTLWYVNAVLQYLKYTGNFAFVKDELWDNLQAIIENHQKGTQYGIRLDEDGLLIHGPRLTWMDAVVEGDMITPRAGKAVEIQALWYNTLQIMTFLASKFVEDDLAHNYRAMANLTRKSFNEKFWNPKLGCLFDVLEPNGGVDASLRPNQICAVSLDFGMLEKEKAQRIVQVVNDELVTPFGLRTLALNDPKFVGKCLGDRRSRDMAYHNGTIWPWLLGPYVTAYLKVNDYTSKARQEALQKLIVPLFSVGIHQGGLGTINEIYDCDPPNAPRGCIAQAWSVGEPLRAYIEDVLMVKPKKI